MIQDISQSPISSQVSSVLSDSTVTESTGVMTPRMIREARRDSIMRHTHSGSTDADIYLGDYGIGIEAISSDSALVDSVARHIREFWEPLRCTEADAPNQAMTSAGRESYFNGIAGIPRPELLGYNSGVMSLLLVAFLWISLTIPYHTKFLKTFIQDLWSVRTRSNVFEDRTVGETSILASLIMLVCICEGLLLFSVVRPVGIPCGIFGGVGLMVCLAALYYLWQLLAYTVTGYAFTDSVMASQWVKGFNASQALLGLTLTVPALWVAFHPVAAEWVIPLSILLYGIARIVFICKGFRIFYDKFSSLVYFILYLCTLEIVPLIFIFRVCRSI